MPGLVRKTETNRPWHGDTSGADRFWSASLDIRRTMGASKWDACNVRLRAVDRASVDGAPDHPADLRVRQEQVVVDDAPALRGGVDHVQAEPDQLGLFGGADAGDAAGEEARHGQRPVVG